MRQKNFVRTFSLCREMYDACDIREADKFLRSRLFVWCEIEMLVGFGLVPTMSTTVLHILLCCMCARALFRISSISPAFSFVRSFVQQTFFVVKNIATLLLLLYHLLHNQFSFSKTTRALLCTIILILIFTRDE